MIIENFLGGLDLSPGSSGSAEIRKNCIDYTDKNECNAFVECFWDQVDGCLPVNCSSAMDCPFSLPECNCDVASDKCTCGFLYVPFYGF